MLPENAHTAFRIHYTLRLVALCQRQTRPQSDCLRETSHSDRPEYRIHSKVHWAQSRIWIISLALSLCHILRRRILSLSLSLSLSIRIDAVCSLNMRASHNARFPWSKRAGWLLVATAANNERFCLRQEGLLNKVLLLPKVTWNFKIKWYLGKRLPHEVAFGILLICTTI